MGKSFAFLASVIINIIVENHNRFYWKEILVMEFHISWKLC